MAPGNFIITTGPLFFSKTVLREKKITAAADVLRGIYFYQKVGA